MRASSLAAALVVLALLLSCPGPGLAAGGHDLSYIPTDHWSYQAFYRLASLGLVPLQAVSVRPITRLEARRLLQEATFRFREAGPLVARLAQEDLRRLTQEFSVASMVEVTVSGLRDERSTDFIPNRSLGTSFVAAGYAPNSGFWLYGRAFGGGRSGDPLRGELYGSFQLGSILMQLGRTSSSWGPSLRSSLLLSDNAGTLPLFRLSAEIPRVWLTKTVVSLERFGGSPPGDVVLFATRLDWMATPRFRLGFSEAVVTAWGGPFTFYHLLQPLPVFSAIVANYHLHDILGQARNTSVAVDFDWLVRLGTRAYGALFVDDALDGLLERRARIGILGGLYLVDPFGTGKTSLRLEYSAVTNGTYSYCCGLDHAYQGRSLGHWLGPDGDDVYLELTHQLNEATSLQLSYGYTRRGQGRIGQPSPPPEDWFLSGIVERRHTLGIGLRRIHAPSFETHYRVEVASVTNRGNVSGASAWEGLLGVELTYRWPAVASAPGPSVQPTNIAPRSNPGPIPPSIVPSSLASIFPDQLSLRSWSSVVTSSGPVSGPATDAGFNGISYRTPVGTTMLSLSYDGGGAQAFWSADLHYPLTQLEHGAISISAGWGGVTYTGVLGGIPRSLSVQGPRLGAAFSYQLTINNVGTPFYLRGEISSPPLRALWGPRGENSLSYVWTYDFGAGWKAQSGFGLEVGYRGGAGVWQASTPNQTNLRWDGFYLSVLFK